MTAKLSKLQSGELTMLEFLQTAIEANLSDEIILQLNSTQCKNFFAFFNFLIDAGHKLILYDL